MEDKDVFNMSVTERNTGNYLSCSNDMEIILRGKGLWKFVAPAVMTANEVRDQQEMNSGAATNLDSGSELKRI